MKTLPILCAFVLLCSISAQAQSFEWRYMNSAITAFAQQPEHPNVVFAGDAAGLIRKSEDGGATWKTVSLQSEPSINDIAFLDSQKGFAATAWPGLILVTSDGGNTWQRKQFVDAAAPDNASRFHPTTRIIVVDNKTAFFDIFDHPISNPSARETIVTRDGGATFRIDSVPGEVYHVEGETMMAFGREPDKFGLSKFTVYKSTDKGASWNIVKTSPTGLGSDFNNNGIELAFFLSADEFFLTANKRLASNYFIYKTTDGGNTFTALPEFIAKRKAKAEYIYFKNSSEGFALSQPANGETAFYTTDGGQTWTPASQKPQSVALYLGNSNLIAYKDDHTTFSTDFGKTWVDQADKLNTAGGSTGLQFLQVVNNDVMYASMGRLSGGVYYGRELGRTTDGGLSWHRVKNPNEELFVGENFYFVDKDTFFYIGSGYNEEGTFGGYMKIKYTTDGGLTAKDVFTGGYNEDVQGIVFIDKQHAVTYSINSFRINFSSDGGQSWNKIETSSKMGQIEKIVFPSVDSWYLLATDKKIWRSTDQGKNWNDVSVSATTKCGSIVFTNATTGYVYGCFGKFYKTTDGGTTWQDYSAGLDVAIEKQTFSVLEFQSETVGYMAGKTVLARTVDGGESWQQYGGSQLSSNIAKINVADENTAAMMDMSGNIAVYTKPMPFTTDTVKISTGVVSVLESSEKYRSILYPNPANEFVVVETGSELVQSVAVADILGRVYIRIQPAAGSTVNTIATSSLPVGTYIVTVKTTARAYTQRLNIVR